MATTTNYGWTTPDDTALVKDGAAAIRTLGSSVDTTTKALNPSTTLGDLEYRSATANTNTRLAIGTTGQVLQVTGGVPAWGAAPAAAASYSLLNSGGTALTAATTITVSGITGINSLLIVVDNASSVNASSEMEIRFNTDSTSKYAYWGLRDSIQSPYDAGMLVSNRSTSATSFTVCKMANNAGSLMQGAIEVTGCNSSGIKIVDFSFAASQGGGVNNERNVQKGYYSGTSTISSVSIISSTGNWDSGTVFIYGSAV